MQTVARGEALQLTFDLYAPRLQQLTDPDECPDGPRLTITPAAGGAPVFSDVGYARHLATGRFAFVVTMTLDAGVMADGEYVCTVATATQGGVPLVDAQGAAPRAHFVLLDQAIAVDPDRFYADPAALAADWGLDPVPTDMEVRAAQVQLDNWMHRSLWPTVYAPPPFRLRGATVFLVPHRPLLQVLTCEGGYLPGRRHARWSDPVGDPSFLGLRGWTPILVSQLQINTETGHVWIPSGTVGGIFTQVRTSYLAGYHAIPKPAKLAVAQTIAWIRFKGFSDLQRYSEGQVSREMGNALIPQSAQDACEEFRVKAYR